ncbi:hypothetical protein HGQ77_05390, partial [Staphylococcus aureus]|nr:hypothetical protein [Staphylococcus aureus]
TFSPCNTKGLAISGGDVGGSKNFDAFVEQKVDVAKGFGIDEDVARRLASKYGSIRRRRRSMFTFRLNKFTCA